MCFDLDSTPPVPSNPEAVADQRMLTLTSADGTRFAAFAALPRERSDVGVVVLPDVRGLYRFYREIALRLAEAGHPAVAIDYYGRTAGVAERDEDFPFLDHLLRLTRDGIHTDVAAAIAHLRSDVGGACRRVVTLGFCFGGRQSFLAATRGHDHLVGVIGYYGLPGYGPDGSPGPTQHAAEMTVPVLALMGGADEVIPPSEVAAFEEALAAAGVEHEVVTYPGAPHSFFDLKHDGKYAEASADSWRRVLDFLRRCSAA